MLVVEIYVLFTHVPDSDSSLFGILVPSVAVYAPFSVVLADAASVSRGS